MQPISNRIRSSLDLGSIALGGLLVAMPLASAIADATLPPISIGGGIRTSFTHTKSDSKVFTDAAGDPSDKKDDFSLDSIRLYLNGSVTDTIKFMFNTEYNGANESVTVLDAVARFEFSNAVNFWVGRFLPPSDRANLYGPYYANNWNVYNDGVQDGYPFETTGRDDGAVYWGQFGGLKLSAGAFDVNNAIQKSTTGSSDVLWAGRAMYDFWEVENGYYLNGTYYGEKDLLALGVAGQSAGTGHAYSGDFLLEKKLGGAGVLNIEAEYAKYDGLGGYPSPRGVAYDSTDGYYALASFLFPQVVGIGKFQVLGKYADAKFKYPTLPDVTQKTTEVDVNYIIKSFNARISLFFVNFSYDGISNIDSKQIGLGIQLQI